MTPTLIGLLSKYYAPLPGPGADSYEAARTASRILKSHSSEVGIIACALSRQGYLYVGISPKLWDALGSKFSTNKEVSDALKAGGLKGGTIWTDSKVDGTLLATIEFNKGCAEKRVLSAALKYSDTITEISVTEHPVGSDPGGLAKHVTVGTSSGDLYYGPCDSCLQFAKLVFK